MGAGADDLLAGGPGRLEDEDGLCQDEHANALEERVRAEERDEGWVLEDGGPDECDEQDGAALSQPAGSCRFGGSPVSSCQVGWAGVVSCGRACTPL